MNSYNPMVITFAIYLVVVLLVGIAGYFSTKNFDDFILGGRRLGSFVTAMSAGASDMSGWLLMGLPGAIYLSGLSEAWIAIGLVIGAYLNWYFVAGRLRVHTKVNNNSLTLPDYFFNRFGGTNKTIKIASAVIILFFFTIYCASGIVAGARLFMTLFDVDYVTAMWLGAGATILYTFIGGFLAVSWTDSIQASLMFFALVLTPVLVLFNIGGFDDVSMIVSKAATENNIDYSTLFPVSGAVTIASGLAWGFGYFGQPHILARFMASESVKSVERARRISITWMILCLAGAVSVGYFGIAYFSAHPGDVDFMLGQKENVFMALAKLLFNPWIAGIILSAILAAIMSTLSCQLLVCSSAITEDFYKGFLRPRAQQSELVWVGRFMVLAVAVVAILIASNPDSSILNLVSYAWAGFGAAFGPIVLISVMTDKITEKGALAGMITGALVVILWRPLTGSALYELLPGFVISSLVIWLVSRFTADNKAVKNRFAEADAQYKTEMRKIRKS